MALAQHHEIPTRLLDWSSNPYVACYHAAASAVLAGRECLKPDQKIAVFAFDFNDLSKVTGIKHVKVPGALQPIYLLNQGRSSWSITQGFGERHPRCIYEVKIATTFQSIKESDAACAIGG